MGQFLGGGGVHDGLLLIKMSANSVPERRGKLAYAENHTPGLDFYRGMKYK